MNIEIVKDFDKFLSLEPIWNNFLARSDSDFPFLTFEWLSCWWRSYGKGSELLVLLIKEQNEIIGIAPLMRTKIRFRGMFVNAITFLANYHSNRSGFILLKEKINVVKNIINFLFNSDIKFDLLCFDFLAEGSNTEKDLNEVLLNKVIRTIKKQSNVSPYILINIDWFEYLKKRSKNFKGKLKNTNNKLEKHGGYEIVRYKKEGIATAINDIMAISENTWKFKAKTAIASNSENTNFYESFAKLASLRNWLDIWVLKIDEKPVSFLYNLNYKNKTFFLKVGHNENFGYLSPGLFLLNNSIKCSFDERYLEYDLLGNNERYKLGFTSTCRTHYKYFIFRNNLVGNIMYLVENNLIPFVKNLIFKKIKNEN